MTFTVMTKRKPWRRTGKYSKPLGWLKTLATSPTVSFPTPDDCVTEKRSLKGSKANSQTLHGKSSIIPSWCQYRLLTKGALIITTKYICPHCLGVHIHDSPMSSLMKTKTYRHAILRCSKSSLPVGSLRLEIDGNQFTVSGVLRRTESTK